MSCCTNNKNKLKCKCVSTIASDTSFNVVSPSQDFDWKTFNFTGAPYGGTGLNWNESDIPFWFDRVSYAGVISVEMTTTDPNVEYIYWSANVANNIILLTEDISVQAIDLKIQLYVGVPPGTIVPLTFTYSGGGTERIAIGTIQLT
tara:strand:- start:6196 stop:6633 length:438 start_codon:yes stop_codon:yes gene_type:complete